MIDKRVWIGVGVAVVVAFAGWVWWRENANERRTDMLLDDARARIEVEFGSSVRGPHTTQSGFRVCDDIDDSYGSKELQLIDPQTDTLAVAEPVARSYEADDWTVQRSIIYNDSFFSRLQVDALRGTDRVMLSFFGDAVRVMGQTGECLTRLGFLDRPERNVEFVETLPTERPPDRSQSTAD